ncbi:SDR family oxidoreductase [Streptomyces sp. NPDC007126]|uniref:SDR family oxidoreductase n=1 Tax=Streptomyces sp. NPDC007126 TaxID=3364774 RepID=UPI0036970DF6
MKVVVVDGGGLMGVETALWVRDHGHEVVLVQAPVPGGPHSSTCDEIAEALRGSSVVVDLAHQPSADIGTLSEDHGLVVDEAALVDAWARSTGELLRAGAAAGVRHHVCLSVVGVDRIGGGGVFRALRNREVMVRRAGIPYTILRATQTFDAAEDIATAATEDWIVWVPPAEVRPVSLTDVATLLAHTAVTRPLNGVREIAGPEQFRLDTFVRTALMTEAEYRQVRTDALSPFYGARLRPLDLLPGPDAFIARTTYREWFAGRPAPDTTS